MNSVQEIRDKGMCCGCGICAAVCPQHAICHELSEDGQSGPQINDACVGCGICKAVCPGADMLSRGGKTDGIAVDTQMASACKLVQSRNSELVRASASGGFITTLIRTLLDRGEYDSAFLVDSYVYNGVVSTKRIQRQDELDKTQKSRYVQVAHTDEISYIIDHPQEKVLLVGTPCYFRGFLKVVERYRLNRDNYLLIGLFCDKTMTTHVWEYFETVFAKGNLMSMYFKDKEKSGWPGDVKLFLQDGTEQLIPGRERMDVKDYFAVESCIYCVDKLNEAADLSVGDNFISRKTDSRENGKSSLNVREGSNTVILRTKRAQKCWESVQELFWWEDCTMEQVKLSQKMERRLRNRENLELKENGGDSKTYRMALDRMEMGRKRQYEAIRREVEMKRRKQSDPMHRLLTGCKKIYKKLMPRR